jgi:hypothetical protein
MDGLIVLYVILDVCVFASASASIVSMLRRNSASILPRLQYLYQDGRAWPCCVEICGSWDDYPGRNVFTCLSAWTRLCPLARVDGGRWAFALSWPRTQRCGAVSVRARPAVSLMTTSESEVVVFSGDGSCYGAPA